MIVQGGSYGLACPACDACGPVTSFLSVRPHLTGTYRAFTIGDDGRQKAALGEGNGQAFMDQVAAAARTGDRVVLTPLDP